MKSIPDTPTQSPQKTGILVHGCNLHTYQWKTIVWGKSPSDMGRIPKGIFTALFEQADVMVFGTGASEKNGVLEADASARLMWERFDDIREFDLFQRYFPDIGDDGYRNDLRDRIASILEIENTAQNTVEEVVKAGKIFKRADVERIILISSPTHLPRCLRDACVAFDLNEDLAHFRHWLAAMPSDTSYMGKTAADVAVFEPPHRQDRPMFNINDFLKRVDDVPGLERPAFLRKFDELLQDFDV